MRAADYLIDVGPDAGRLGGEIVFEGNVEKLNPSLATAEKEALSKQHPTSHTIPYLLGTETIEVPTSRRSWKQSIELKGARMNNLRGVDVQFPLNTFTVVTGVSGSGKSSLIK